MVKAKFRCMSVNDHGTNKQVTLQAVHSSEGENADYAKATPSGQLHITIDNETKASEYFKPGNNYYLNIEEAQA